MARSPARRRRAAGHDRTHPRHAARRPHARGRAVAHDARRARHRVARAPVERRRRCSRGPLAFDDADATRATYRRVPGVATSGGGPPELPWPLRLERRDRRHAVSDDRRAHACCSTRRASPATYGGGRLDLEQVTTTWGDAAFVADASFELRDGIDFDVAGDWSAPLAGVASNGTVTLTGHVAASCAFTTSSRRRSPQRRTGRSRSMGRSTSTSSASGKPSHGPASTKSRATAAGSR